MCFVTSTVNSNINTIRLWPSSRRTLLVFNHLLPGGRTWIRLMFCFPSHVSSIWIGLVSSCPIRFSKFDDLLIYPLLQTKFRCPSFLLTTLWDGLTQARRTSTSTKKRLGCVWYFFVGVVRGCTIYCNLNAWRKQYMLAWQRSTLNY